MTPTLLPNLPSQPGDPLQPQVEVSERLGRLFLEEVTRLIQALTGSAKYFEDVWQRCVNAAARGETERVQAQRERLLSAFDARLRLLRRAADLAKLTNGDARTTDLTAELARMDLLAAKVFPLWQTSEDLEDLAARDYPLSAEDLDRIGRGRQPPQSWYEEQSRPF